MFTCSTLRVLSQVSASFTQAVAALSTTRFFAMGACGESPVVSTNTGRLKGLSSRCLGSKIVFSYRNVPYGKPPTGKLRFMPPEAASSWSGILDCSARTNIPIQNLDAVKEMGYYTPNISDINNAAERMSEDCLRLSVYTPENYISRKRPVMVWLYGGAFQMGFADMYDGSILCALHDVVVVIPNYRVGIFGFFSLGRDSPCTGNAGLLDQRLALQWVHNNIEAFGGDKNNVTIFGESAGGCSVNHHVNSSMSSGLFHKAISHSGQSTLPKIFKRDLTRARENLLDILDIENRDPSKVLDILQKLPASKLASADREVQMRFMAFNPTIDGKFVHKDPTQSLVEGPVNKVPYIIGCNDSEGHGMLTLLARLPLYEEGMTGKMMRVLITNFIPRMSPEATEECQQASIEFYVKNSNDRYRFSKAYGDIYTDSLFIAPAVTTATSLTEAGCPVYFYYGAYQLRMNHDKTFGPQVGQKPDWCYCDHSDDIFMTWGVPLVPGELSGGGIFTEEEKELSLKCMKYITNFAKTGNPNVGEPVELEWPRYTPRGKYIELAHDMKIGEDLLPEKVEFWKETIFKIKRKHEQEVMKARL